MASNFSHWKTHAGGLRRWNIYQNDGRLSGGGGGGGGVTPYILYGTDVPLE